jgi:DNA-binding transcriptional LysR family regulator
MMELRQLRHFLAVAETGSFSAAAEQVYVSQSALTRSIQHLESTLGGSLLKRGVRRTVTTAAGDQLLQFARMILQDCTDAAAEVQAIKSGAVGAVTLGLDPLLAFQILDSALTRLAVEAPGIAIRALEGTSAELVAAVEAGTMDFAITRLADETAASKRLACDPLLGVEPVIVAGRKHPLARRRSVEVKDLIGSMWLVSDDPQSLELHERFVAASGIPATRAVRTNSLALIRDQVLGGAFLSIVPEPVVRRELRHRQIRRLDVRASSLASRLKLYLVAGRDVRQPPAVARAIEIVRAALAAERGR